MKSTRTRFAGSAALLVTTLLAGAAAARGELIAWWPLDSAAVTPAADAAPGTRHRLIFAGSGELSDGRSADTLAWSTTGGDSALVAEFPATTAFSFSAWVRLETASADSQLATVARLGERNSSGWALYVGAGGTWTAYAYGAQARKLDSKVIAKPGEWTHLALTFAPATPATGAGESTGLLSLYVNGRLANKGEFSIAREAGTSPFMLGARHANNAASWPFGGQIAQVAVWDEVIPSSLAVELAKGRSPGAGMR